MNAPININQHTPIATTIDEDTYVFYFLLPTVRLFNEKYHTLIMIHYYTVIRNFGFLYIYEKFEDAKIHKISKI